ncbi:PAS domain-containing sensor histidine kinase [Hansschlegelia sp. KR7-227]|uniref:PAS domain-containing sensor histidine kinase n=1 Tax=Hansschlegelia sp. KR7-227 TaxID=3400914 RepID=UPI003C10CAC1
MTTAAIEAPAAAAGWPRSIVRRTLAAALALGVFVVDAFTPLQSAVAVLYVLVILIAAKVSRTDLLVTAAASAALTALAYAYMHGHENFGSATLRLIVSLSAIGIGTVLSQQNLKSTETLREQAQLLNLSHDMIFVRDAGGVIQFWNRGAETGYGWPAEQALGQVADDLLSTEYPVSRAEIERQLFRTSRWEGVLHQRTSSGAAIAVESRWVLERSGSGQPIRVLETHRDVSEREASHRALAQSERRYRRMFNASRIGLLQEDWSALRAELDRLTRDGEIDLPSYIEAHPDFLDRAKALVKITDINPAFLEITRWDSPKSVGSSLDNVLGEMDQTFAGSLIAFYRGDRFYEGETQIRGADGRRTPVIFGLTFPTVEEGLDGEVLAFVLDVTDRNEAQNALLAAQAELARAARVATLGELTASITHEVNQPLASIVTNGEAALRWLRRPQPDLVEVSTALARAIEEGKRASAIVRRIRSFLAKGSMRRDVLEGAELVQDAILLVERELSKMGVAIDLQLDPTAPKVIGDRVQLQQVIVNLAVNAGQAMADVGGGRLLVRALRNGSEHLAVTVADNGPGIDPANLERLFDPFFTTKEEGMGMGLAICRSTVEAHGGSLSVDSRLGDGARFTFTIPAA